MEGVTELPTRLWYGLSSNPEFCGTPFLRVTSGFKPDSVKDHVFTELDFPEKCVNYQLIPQLMTPSVDDFCRLALWLLEKSPFVEINCGCPSPTVFGRGAGSALLADSVYFGEFIEEITNRLGPQKLAVKMRTGIESDQHFPNLIDVLSKLPLKYLCIHGRTTFDRYGGKGRWDLIGDAQKTCPFPVIGSGDISDVQSFEKRREISGIQRSIIGRGALRNPWIFEELRTSKKVIIGFDALAYSLASYALLWEMTFTNFPSLKKIMQEGLFLEPCLVDEAKWKKVFKRLSAELFPDQDIDLTNFEITRQTMGKLKLLWNYFRSSLPKEFFEPTMLRNKQFSDFYSQLSGIYQSYSEHRPKNFELTYQPDLDWIYGKSSKEKKKNS